MSRVLEISHSRPCGARDFVSRVIPLTLLGIPRTASSTASESENMAGGNTPTTDSPAVSKSALDTLDLLTESLRKELAERMWSGKCHSRLEIAHVEKERDVLKEKHRLAEKDRAKYKRKYEKAQETLKGRVFPPYLSPETVPSPAVSTAKLILKVSPTRQANASPVQAIPMKQEPRSSSPEPSLPYFPQIRNDLSSGRPQSVITLCNANTISSTVSMRKQNVKSKF